MVEVTKLALGSQIEVEEIQAYRVFERSNPAVRAVTCHKIPDIAILDQKRKLLDLKVVREHFVNEGRLTDMQVYKILDDADAILSKEPNLLEIDKRCYIFGDIHGQFYDLISLINMFDLKSDTLLFLGDYVDRGSFSVEVYLYLMLLKSHYPSSIYLLRGNHESEKMTKYFTFKTECMHKHNLQVYERFVKSFRSLPIAAVVQGKAFCCHGGISPHLKKVRDLNSINRFKEIEYYGIFCDIFWADPHPFYDTKAGSAWEFNEKRRCSVQYNYQNVVEFLQSNSLGMIIRGHEVQESGYRTFKSYNGQHSVVTVFSAPKYCDAYQNMGAYIEFDGEITAIRQFDACPHPFVINGFIDGINWSLPFVGEKAVEFALSLFDELDDVELLDEPEVLATKMTVMRTERESINEFESEDTSVDCCTLATKDNLEMESGFEEAEKKDAENEQKKDEPEGPSVSLEVSPSLKNEAIKSISGLDLSTAVKNNEVVTVRKENDAETIEVAKAPARKRGLFFLCGICGG